MFGSGVSAGGGSGGGGGGLSPRATGWANYRDTQYTEAAPFSVAANTRLLLPNNAGTKDESQLPEDMTTFYNPSTRKVLSTNGSDFVMTVRLKLKPKEAEASMIRLDLEIAQPGSPFIIESALRSIPWGVDVESALNFTFSGYAREAFSNHGAQLFVQSDGEIEIYGISYVLKRTHRGV